MSLTNAEQAALDTLRKHVKKNNIGHTTKGGRRDPNGSPEGLVTDPSQFIGLHASTEILVKDIAAKLVHKWPGFRWAIQPNEQGKVFNIFCLDFHTIWGYVIRYDDVMNDPRRKEAIKAGAEILRRFRYMGNRYDPIQIAKMPRTLQGHCIPDVSDLKPTRFTRQADLQHKLATGKARIVMKDDKGNQVLEVKE